MTPGNQSPSSNFNPWRIAVLAFLLLIVGFGVFYVIQPSGQTPETSSLPIDPQSRPVEQIAPATGEAERDLTTRSGNAEQTNTAIGAPTEQTSPSAKPGVVDLPFAPEDENPLPLEAPPPAKPLDAPTSDQTQIDNQEKPAMNLNNPLPTVINKAPPPAKPKSPPAGADSKPEAAPLPPG